MKDNHNKIVVNEYLNIYNSLFLNFFSLFSKIQNHLVIGKKKGLSNLISIKFKLLKFFEQKIIIKKFIQIFKVTKKIPNCKIPIIIFIYGEYSIYILNKIFFKFFQQKIIFLFKSFWIFFKTRWTKKGINEFLFNFFFFKYI